MLAKQLAGSKTMAQPFVQFVNSFPPPTAIWRYASLMLHAYPNSSNLATVCVGNFDFTRVNRSISRVYGDFPAPRLVRSLVNSLLPQVGLRELVQRCGELEGNGGVIHYLAEDIRPWTKHGNVVVTVHGNPLATIESTRYYSFNPGYRALVRSNLRTYSRVAECIVQSNYVKDGLSTFGYEGSIQLIPPALDPVFHPRPDVLKLRQKLGLPDSKILILSISTSEKRKNLPVLPRTLDCLPTEYKLVRIGPAVRGALNLSDLSDAQVAEVYNACDLLLFPTLEEGFGLPVIEAFASGLPVVSSDIEVIREVAGDAAILVDPSSPDMLARACREAVSQRDVFARRGLIRAKDFSISLLSARLMQFYDQLIRVGG